MPEEGKNPLDSVGDSPETPNWDIFIPLVEDSDLDAVPCIPNKPGEVHRADLTGYDRDDIPCVRGRLYHVVHGFLGSSSSKPQNKTENKNTRATLIVFEWEFHPQLPAGGHRFRQVDIKVAFEPAAAATAGNDLAHAPETFSDKAYYAPHVIDVAPRSPIKSLVRTMPAPAPWAVGAKIALGFAPFVTFELSVADDKTSNGNSITTTTETTTTTGTTSTTTTTTSMTTIITDCRLVAGIPVTASPDSSHNDAATWTLCENESLQSGVQSPVRTAVLVTYGTDDYGGGTKFVLTLKTKATLSSFRARLAGRIRRWIGLVPVDDRVYFDASHGPGAVVIAGRKDGVDGRRCPCDVWNLGNEDLSKFLLEDED